MLQYFNNERYEAEQYDRVLRNYSDAALKTTTSLSVLNFSQSATFGTALTLLMYMTSQGILSGVFSCVCLCVCVMRGVFVLTLHGLLYVW